MTRRAFTPTVLAAGAAALSAAALPALAQAHDYRGGYYDTRAEACTDRIHDNGTTGALLGAAAGALIGSNVAHHGGRTGGALIGAGVGAAVGSNIARSSTKADCRGPRYRTYYRPAPPAYYGPGYADYTSYTVYPAAPPAYGYGGYGGWGDDHHDRGEHRGWYRHHHEEDEDDGD